MKQVVNHKTFTKEVVVLDDIRYVECLFVSCTLQYSGGNWSIDDCHFTDDCTWSFQGPAYRMLGLLQMFDMIKPSTLFDSKNPPPQIH